MIKPTSYQLSQAHRMLSIEEIDFIKKYVSRLPKKSTLINIGAGFGTSALAMLEVLPDAFIFSIDPKSSLAEIDNVAEAGYSNQVKRLLSKSQDIAWPKSIKVNAVFVDGCHTEKDVKCDIEIYKPTVRENGLMFFHDYGHPNYAPDHLMSKVIDEMMNDWQRLGIARFLVGFKNG